jgi:molybdopterin-guanine dinucleotide biosynthesis protein A
MMHRRRDPIGVILAGGLGRRIGGSKAAVELRGQPLISYPLSALSAALADVAIIAKADTELPSIPGVTVWIEPVAPRHPLVGIVQALALAGDRPVLACAADLPFVTAELVRRIANTDPGDAPAVVPTSGGALQPTLALYLPSAAALLARSLGADLPLRDEIAAIGPRLLEVSDPDVFFNVNTPDDLLRAAAMLDRARGEHRRPTQT